MAAASATFGDSAKGGPDDESQAGNQHPRTKDHGQHDAECTHTQGEGKDARTREGVDVARAGLLGGVGVVLGTRAHATAPPVVVATGQQAQPHTKEHHDATGVFHAPRPVDGAHDAKEEAKRDENLCFGAH